MTTEQGVGAMNSSDAHPRFCDYQNANERPLIVIWPIVPTEWETCFS